MNTQHLDKILVVDDTTANLQLLTNLLTAQGYTVYPASDGGLALEFVRSTLPDLILLDIRMPGIDGFEVCRRLKADERTRSIAIIFISALEDERDKVKGFQAGAVDYVTKPFQMEEVLARVRNHLHLRELTEHLEHKVAERTEELHSANALLQRELTERKAAEAALRQKEILLNAEPSADGSMMTIAVEDTGIGISENNLGKLFSPFVRFHKPGESVIPGTGLGLYLTQKLLKEILKGDILVTSTYGAGSRFTMRVPIDV